MKIRIISTIVITTLLICLSTHSGTWIVDNNIGRSASADFTSLQAAVDSPSVVNGNTIYVMGSSSYGALTVDKELHFIGPGYFLAQNPDTRANISEAQITTLDCNAGSSGSSFTGLYFTNLVDIRDSNITFKRNRFLIADVNINIRILDNSPNTIITQNFIQNFDTSSCCAEAIQVNTTGNSSIEISNNYIQMFNASFEAIRVSIPTIIKNNVIFGQLVVSDSTLSNNILREGSVVGTGNGVNNNIGNGTQFGSFAGNQENVDMTTVFIGSGSDDGQWQLKTGSPAIGAGDDSTDIGMFGGSNPYVLSGIAALPTIYSFISNSTGTNSSDITVNMKIKASE